MSSFVGFMNDSVGYVLCILFTFIYGLCIGSFLNVVILRLPLGQSVVKSESHCFSCNKPIKWYDNIPLISYIILGGRCRNCKAKISVQYPIVEASNGVLWVLIALKFKFSIETLIFCIVTSVLVALSFIDWKTFEIPSVFNLVILLLGVIYSLFDFNNLTNHIIGAVCVSFFLAIIWFITSGQGIGFGDVKLMFTCGLVFGWKIIVMGFLLGCIIAIFVHSLRIKLTKEGSKLAFGPYLSLGVYVSIFVGEYLINQYLTLIGII